MINLAAVRVCIQRQTRGNTVPFDGLPAYDAAALWRARQTQQFARHANRHHGDDEQDKCEYVPAGGVALFRACGCLIACNYACDCLSRITMCLDIDIMTELQAICDVHDIRHCEELIVRGHGLVPVSMYRCQGSGSLASRRDLEEATVSGLNHLGTRTTYTLSRWSVRGPGRLLHALRPRIPHIQLCGCRLHHLPSKRSHCLVLMSTRTDLSLRTVQRVVCACSHAQARRKCSRNKQTSAQLTRSYAI